MQALHSKWLLPRSPLRPTQQSQRALSFGKLHFSHPHHSVCGWGLSIGTSGDALPSVSMVTLGDTVGTVWSPRAPGKGWGVWPRAKQQIVTPALSHVPSPAHDMYGTTPSREHTLMMFSILSAPGQSPPGHDFPNANIFAKIPNPKLLFLLGATLLPSPSQDLTSLWEKEIISLYSPAFQQLGKS